jgi:hypothetical protein
MRNVPSGLVGLRDTYHPRFYHLAKLCAENTAKWGFYLQGVGHGFHARAKGRRSDGWKHLACRLSNGAGCW